MVAVTDIVCPIYKSVWPCCPFYMRLVVDEEKDYSMEYMFYYKAETNKIFS